jgi:regulator of sigma E protease
LIFGFQKGKKYIMNIIVAILILGVIVIIHELGHFLLAKTNGITVTEFSVGMGPRIASFVRKGTRYSLKLFPFGGSCMMLGEDETVDDDGAFHKKGVWARFSVIFAGAFFNFILAFVLALIILGDVGVDKPYVTTIKKDGPAAEAGLQKGDLITAIDGSPIHMSREIMYYYYFNPITDQPVTIDFLRNGEKQSVTLTSVWLDDYKLGFGYTPSDKPAVIESLTKDYPLEKAGIQTGDIIVGINGTKITSANQLADYISENPITKDPMSITYERNGVTSEILITPILEQSGYEMGWGYNQYREKVSALEVVKYSFYELKLNIVNTIKSLLYLFTGKVSMKEVSGPVGIVNVVGDIVDESQDYGFHATFLSLAQFSILLSANLGVMNLLPLPALDGGRLVFLLIEAVRRKPVPKEKEALVHMVGMAALMVLMVLVMFNDIKNIFL